MGKFSDKQLAKASRKSRKYFDIAEELQHGLSELTVSINQCISYDPGSLDREELEEVVKEKMDYAEKLIVSLGG